MIKSCILAILLVSLTACSHMHPRRHQASVGVGHVVICWLKQPGNEAQRQQLIEASNGLKQIPGVLSIRAGRPLASARPVVDSSFDVAIIVFFKDEASLHAYEKDPVHLKAVNEVLNPLTAKRLIYDIDVADGD